MRFLLLLSCLQVSLVLAQEPQPVSVQFGPRFLGYDGNWSPVSIRAGSPEQWLSVFPSTLSSETWLAGENYCTSADQTCSTLRGGIFHNETSSTWHTLGQYEMGYSELLQRTPTAEYGLDVLGLSDALVAPGQIIALVDDIDHWVGSFGVNVQNSRFSGNNNTLPYLSTLVQNLSAIPSHSYGYTAGAFYRSGGVAGSLTLGGVDTGRYQDSKTSFTLSAGYVPSVSLRSIRVASSSSAQLSAQNSSQLMTEAQTASFVIDSSTPYLWLPEAVCDTFARALNLTWNSMVNLYMFGNNTNLQNLIDQNLTFTFTLAGASAGSGNLDMNLSFNAFNLQLSYPFPNLFDQYTDERVNYFPLRRTSNPEQYTIGRAFLQETYLIVDYERNIFSLNQAVFPSNSNQSPQLAAIGRPKDSTWPGPVKLSSGGLSTGAKAGIAAGVVILLLALIGIAVCLVIRKRRRSGESLNDDKSTLLSIFSKRSTLKSRGTNDAAELVADKHHPTELVSDKTNAKFELSAITPHEMPGSEVSPSFFQERTNAVITQRNDPRSPIELVQPPSRSSISKDHIDRDIDEESAVPSYSPVDPLQSYGGSVSPNPNGHHSNIFSNTSDNPISPITGSNGDNNRTHLSVTASDSSRGLSPVSPVTGRSDQKYSDDAITSGSTTHLSTQGKVSPQSTLSPANTAHGIQRSLSRDSRFRENLSDGHNSQSPEGPGMQHDPHAAAGSVQGGQKRFSWE